MQFAIRQLGALSLLLTADCRAQTLRVESPSEWSNPVALPGMPPNRLQRWPIITSVHDTIYVAANVYPINGTAVGERPIYLARIPGGPIPPPPGDFQFVYPKIAAAQDGDVHLIWAEFDSTRQDVLSWSSGTKTALWHSVFTSGAWSSPREVFKADWLEWPKDAGNVSVDASGAVHVVLWTVHGTVSGITHLVGSSSGWRVNRTPYDRREVAVYAQGDTVLVAYAGASFGASDTTGISVAVSPTGGASWTSMVVVQRLGGRNASDLQFIRRGVALYLAWGESPRRGQFGRDTLRVVRLDDLGRRAAMTAVALPAGASTVAVREACGDLAFLVETFSQVPQTFVGKITASGAVSQHSLRPPGELAAFSGIGATSKSVVVVLATRPDPAGPVRAVLMSRHACSTSQDS